MVQCFSGWIAPGTSRGRHHHDYRFHFELALAEDCLVVNRPGENSLRHVVVVSRDIEAELRPLVLVGRFLGRTVEFNLIGVIGGDRVHEAVPCHALLQGVASRGGPARKT
ncbi:hypothetical protein quinque_015739 [Culex quinquefasciatus]